MQAAFIDGVRDIRVGEYRAPAAGAEDVNVAVAGVGICGSDLHYFVEGGIGAATVAAPFVLGHEVAAWIQEDRPELGLARGALVAVDPARPCRACEWCRRGHVNLCPHVAFLGSPPIDGALAETLAVRADQIQRVPAGFDIARTAMLEPLGVAVHGIDLIRPRVGDTVAVLGCGPIGLCLLQVARAAGAARVYAIDPVAYRADAARRLGADAAAGDVAAIDDWTQGRGVDVVAEATNAAAGLELAAQAARIGGRVLLAGIPNGDHYALAAANARRKGLTIKLSRRMGEVYPRAIQLVVDGGVDVDTIVSHRLPLADTARAFELQADCADGVIKSLILPNGTHPPARVAGQA